MATLLLSFRLSGPETRRVQRDQGYGVRSWLYLTGSRLLVIMSAARARCVSGKVIEKLEYGDLHRLEVGFAKVSVMQIRNAKRVVLEDHAVSSPSATRK